MPSKNRPARSLIELIEKPFAEAGRMGSLYDVDMERKTVPSICVMLCWARFQTCIWLSDLLTRDFDTFALSPYQEVRHCELVQ